MCVEGGGVPHYLTSTGLRSQAVLKVGENTTGEMQEDDLLSRTPKKEKRPK